MRARAWRKKAEGWAEWLDPDEHAVAMHVHNCTAGMTCDASGILCPHHFTEGLFYHDTLIVHPPRIAGLCWERVRGLLETLVRRGALHMEEAGDRDGTHFWFTLRYGWKPGKREQKRIALARALEREAYGEKGEGER